MPYGGGVEYADAPFAIFMEQAKVIDGKVLIIPTASAQPDAGQDTKTTLENYGIPCSIMPGVQIIKGNPDKLENNMDNYLPLRQTIEANDDQESYKDVKTIWFCGGKQRRIAAVFVNNPFWLNLLEQLELVGGTSAGASIMSAQMIAYTDPKTNQPVMQEGLGLTQWVIDQHIDEMPHRLNRDKIIHKNTKLNVIALPTNSGVIIEFDTDEIIKTFGQDPIYTI
jgi:cyanophycinase-like exopeptidase